MIILAQTAIESFTSFVESEFKYLLYGGLLLIMVIALIKRAYLWAGGTVLAFAVFAYFGENPDELVEIAKNIARVVTRSGDG